MPSNKALNACLLFVRWTPVIFITGVIVWSYYAYVIQMCIFQINNTAQKVIYLLLYHPILVIFAWTYWRTIFADPGFAPKEFYLSADDIERFERETSEDHQREILCRHGRNLPVQCRTTSGSFRYCDKCKCIKPDRAHHCSICGRCVLKMDHHCPWVNNCVNFTNYKFFILFLGYALLYCLFVAATSLQFFIKFWTQVGGAGADGSLHILFLFFAGIMFAISVSSLFGYHLYLTSKNRSTLESFRAPSFRSGPDKDGFSLGCAGNFTEVFGDDSSKWFLPIFSSRGDGVTFPTRVTHPPTPTRNGSVEQVPNSFGDGVTYPVRTVDEDYDGLLAQRQRWMEEGEEQMGYVNTTVAHN